MQVFAVVGYVALTLHIKGMSGVRHDTDTCRHSITSIFLNYYWCVHVNVSVVSMSVFIACCLWQVNEKLIKIVDNEPVILLEHTSVLALVVKSLVQCSLFYHMIISWILLKLEQQLYYICEKSKQLFLVKITHSMKYLTTNIVHYNIILHYNISK